MGRTSGVLLELQLGTRSHFLTCTRCPYNHEYNVHTLTFTQNNVQVNLKHTSWSGAHTIAHVMLRETEGELTGCVVSKWY